MSNGVLVIGAINVDLVVGADRLPAPGETVVGPRLDRFGGGKGANAAVAAARMDARVRYCGGVGTDDLGREALAELTSLGIDVSDVAEIDDIATGAALIVVDRAGENQIAVAAGANSHVDPAGVRAAVERSVGWAGCVLVSTEISTAAVRSAVAAAREHGLPCVLNPAPLHEDLVSAVRAATVLTPNASELRDLCDALSIPHMDVDDAAARVADTTGACVAVTRGAEGALIARPDGGIERIPALAAPEVRDTTGAGDTFNGVLAASLAAGNTLDEACRRAVIAASLSVRQVGARTGMPSAEEVAIARV